MRPETQGGLTIFSYGFRPFFLAAGIWAVLAIVIWMLVLESGLSLPSRFDPVTWHIHEMLFGFVMAAIAGFLLTAIANWTGRRPVQGPLLGLLATLWLAGRVVCLFSALVEPWQAIVVDLAFPMLFLCVVLREIFAARNWRNLPLLAPVLVLGAANLLMHLEAYGYGIRYGLGWRLAICAIVILISVIAGRIVPTFSRNWLLQHQSQTLPRSGGAVDRVSLGVLHTSLLLWVVFPQMPLVGMLLVAAAACNLGRLWRWRGDLVTEDPLLLILHLGYAWLVIGVGLLGISVWSNLVPTSAAIHALTVGAASTMILAVMTRATRGHTGRPLTADGVTQAVYVLIVVAAIVRVLAAIGICTQIFLLVSAACWIGAFLGFLAAYGPMLLRKRIVSP